MAGLDSLINGMFLSGLFSSFVLIRSDSCLCLRFIFCSNVGFGVGDFEIIDSPISFVYFFNSL